MLWGRSSRHITDNHTTWIASHTALCLYMIWPPISEQLGWSISGLRERTLSCIWSQRWDLWPCSFGKSRLSVLRLAEHDDGIQWLVEMFKEVVHFKLQTRRPRMNRYASLASMTPLKHIRFNNMHQKSTLKKLHKKVISFEAALIWKIYALFNTVCFNYTHYPPQKTMHEMAETQSSLECGRDRHVCYSIHIKNQVPLVNKSVSTAT